MIWVLIAFVVLGTIVSYCARWITKRPTRVAIERDAVGNVTLRGDGNELSADEVRRLDAHLVATAAASGTTRYTEGVDDVAQRVWVRILEDGQLDASTLASTRPRSVAMPSAHDRRSVAP
jgi:hypothetical protein